MEGNTCGSTTEASVEELIQAVAQGDLQKVKLLDLNDLKTAYNTERNSTEETDTIREKIHEVFFNACKNKSLDIVEFLGTEFTSCFYAALVDAASTASQDVLEFLQDNFPQNMDYLRKNKQGATILNICLENTPEKDRDHVLKILGESWSKFRRCFELFCEKDRDEDIPLLLKHQNDNVEPEDQISTCCTDTSLINAIEKQKTHVIKQLVAKKRFVHLPHQGCSDCTTIEKSLGILRAYQAMADPVYLALTWDKESSQEISQLEKQWECNCFLNRWKRKIKGCCICCLGWLRGDDETKEKYDQQVPHPVLKAFYLARDLKIRARFEHNNETYQKLSAQCVNFTVMLLDECKEEKELNYMMDLYGKGITSGETQDKIAAIRVAVKQGHKPFIAHEKTQQILNDVIYDGFPDWRKRCWKYKILWSAWETMFLVVLTLWHIFFPKGSEVIRRMNSPLVKFVHHTGWFLMFLILLVISSVQYRWNDPTDIPAMDIVAYIWVFALVLQETKQAFKQGWITYTSKWWNWVDMVMAFFFFVSLVLWVAASAVGGWIPFFKDLTPKDSYNLLLLSNSFFSIGSVVAFFHLAHSFQISSKLGPLQHSLYKMIKDVSKFAFIFCILYLSFAVGVEKLYSYFVMTQKMYNSVNGNFTLKLETKHILSGYSMTFQRLFWSLFGDIDLEVFKTDSSFAITQNTGEMLFAVYTILTIFIALNMLIAMMSNTFERIKEDEDMQWKNSRTRMWLEWIEKGSILAPPFNLLPDVYYIIKLIKTFYQKQCKNKFLTKRMEVKPIKSNSKDNR